MDDNKLFSTDVLHMKNLIGRTVSIGTVDNRIHTGTVYVVDPIYKTVVLINKSTNCLEFVLHHAMKSFEVLSDIRNEDMFRGSNTIYPEDPMRNKTKLTKWLKQMFIDVKEDDGFLRVEDHLLIGPPYRKTDCMCDNTIVLQRIQNIIDMMPAEFD